MIYIKTAGKKYPVTLADIVTANPNVSIPPNPSPAALAGLGYEIVEQVAPPAINPMLQQVGEIEPVKVDGKWRQQWQILPLSAADIAIRQAAAVEALKSNIVAATQRRLDAWAATRNYDGILSACTYATSAVPKFAAEGQAAVNARDNTWITLYGILADVQSGKRPAPTGYAQIESELPVLVWD